MILGEPGLTPTDYILTTNLVLLRKRDYTEGAELCLTDRRYSDYFRAGTQRAHCFLLGVLLKLGVLGGKEFEPLSLYSASF